MFHRGERGGARGSASPDSSTATMWREGIDAASLRARFGIYTPISNLTTDSVLRATARSRARPSSLLHSVDASRCWNGNRDPIRDRTWPASSPAEPDAENPRLCLLISKEEVSGVPAPASIGGRTRPSGPGMWSTQDIGLAGKLDGCCDRL